MKFNKNWIFYFFLLPLMTGVAQANSQTLYLSKPGWKITIPEGYLLKDTMQNSPFVDSPEVWKGEDRVSYPHNILFAIEKDSYRKMVAANSASAIWMPYDSTREGSWDEFIRRSDSLLLKVINVEGIKTDTTIGTVVLAGIQFDKMEMTTNIFGNAILWSINLSAPFGDHALLITISYTDEKEKDRLLDMVKKSSFSNRH